MVRFEKQDRSPAFSLLALKCDSVHFARKLGDKPPIGGVPIW
jgi:hypothetical protein